MDRETRIKRLRLRSWRRGTKEIDLLLGRFADQAAPELPDAEIGAFERLLEVEDHDIYAWILNMRTPSETHRPLIERIQAFHNIC